jgi:hypothetical protein
MRCAWDTRTGHLLPADDLVVPRGQKEARHAKANLLVRIVGGRVVVRSLKVLAEKPPPYIYDRTNPNDWHRGQAHTTELNKQWFAAAFHLERLYRLQSFDAAVRRRLLAALKQTPDSPAGRAVRQRLIAFDAARLAGAAGGALPPPLAGPVPPLASAQPTRMPYAD